MYLMIATPATRQGVLEGRLDVMTDNEEEEKDVSKTYKGSNSLFPPSKGPMILMNS